MLHVYLIYLYACLDLYPTCLLAFIDPVCVKRDLVCDKRDLVCAPIGTSKHACLHVSPPSAATAVALFVCVSNVNVPAIHVREREREKERERQRERE